MVTRLCGGRQPRIRRVLFGSDGKLDSRVGSMGSGCEGLPAWGVGAWSVPSDAWRGSDHGA
eukprot:10107391-Alexandrium_andersonii.AAC.1